MENKYYTPKIEEFHVGFEYEVLHDDNKWIKESICKKPEVVSLPYMILENIRVKYLDREDIESFGWKKQDEDTFELGKHTLYYKRFNENFIEINVLGDYDGEFCHFKGHLKNKIELKRLMEQLGII
jgi:hypothetical protein